MFHTAAMAPPNKKRRLSDDNSTSTAAPDFQFTSKSRRESSASKNPHRSPSSSRAPSPTTLATQAITPFLAKHLPSSIHAPMGQTQEQNAAIISENQTAGSKYCYRHRSDLQCRRQADEPSMDQLQKDIESLEQPEKQTVAHVWALFSAAPAKTRNLMLQGILTQCCFPQLSYLATKTRELIKIDFMTALPTELAVRVLCYLDTTSLTKAAQVSKNWRSLADDDVVWHKMCEQHIDRKCRRCGWGLPLLDKRRLVESKSEIQRRVASMAQQVVQTECGSHTTEPTSELLLKKTVGNPARPQTRPWKEVYRDRFRVGCNWKYGRFTTKILRGHTDGVMALQFNDTVLATGSYDSTIKIWDLQTGEVLRTLEGHASGVRCLHLHDSFLLSGSLDHTIRVWNYKTGTLNRVINHHTGGVLSLHFVGKIFASGSQDNTIRITDFTSNTSFALTGHTDWVNCVRIDAASRTLFSASDDCTIRLWDLDTRQTIRTFTGHTAHVQQVMPLPREYDLDEDPCGHEHSGSFYRSESGTPDPEATGSSSPTEPMPLFDQSATRSQPPRYILTSSLDNTTRLWDVHSGREVKTFFGHVEGVWALAVDNLKAVTGAQDRTVKVWDPKTGSCERTITGHSGPVTCIALGDSTMFTGGEDGDVRMYSWG